MRKYIKVNNLCFNYMKGARMSYLLWDRLYTPMSRLCVYVTSAVVVTRRLTYNAHARKQIVMATKLVELATYGNTGGAIATK